MASSDNYKVLMTNVEFVDKLEDIATNYKTLYIKGCFGAPMTERGKKKYSKNNSYNEQPSRQKKILEASEDTFGFDCVCLVKGVLWGWNGDLTKLYGGAEYASNTVPDLAVGSIIKRCSDVSTDLTKIDPGELMYKDGHVGVYIGNNRVVECTPSWNDKVQITSVNIKISGLPQRKNWEKHGKLPWIEYVSLDGSADFKEGDYVRLLRNKTYINRPLDEEAMKKVYKIDFIDESLLYSTVVFVKDVEDAYAKSIPMLSLDIAKTEYTPEPEPEPEYEPAVGDTIIYDKDYTYLYANLDVKRKKQIPGTATITRIYKLGKSKHPYHIKGKNLRGYVDEKSFKKG